MTKHKPICNAPFENIYIDRKGNVTPCCFNRDDVFGNIYNDEIEKIWNSSNAKTIRKTLLDYKFPQGCWACEKALQAKNYYNSGIFTYSKLNYKKLKIQAIDFELSYWCNLSCIMCNLHTKNYELTQEQENEILKKINPVLVSLKKARFYGGEPLLIPIYRKIWQNILNSNPNCNILVQTNGTLIDDELKTLAKKRNFTFNISIDSLNPENAAKIRRGSNIELIIENIRQLKKHSTNNIGLAVTPMRLNWKDMPELVKFANKESLQIFFNSIIQPKSLSLWTLDAASLKQIVDFYNNHINYFYNLISYFNFKKFKGLINYIKYLETQAIERPNYSNDKIEQLSMNIYNEILKLLPQLALKNKDKILSELRSILSLHKAEEILFKINNTSAEWLENKIKELLKNK